MKFFIGVIVGAALMFGAWWYSRYLEALKEEQ